MKIFPKPGEPFEYLFFVSEEGNVSVSIELEDAVETYLRVDLFVGDSRIEYSSTFDKGTLKLTANVGDRFWEMGYFACAKTAKVLPSKTTEVRCELRKIPKVELKISAEPEEVLANGFERFVITVELVDGDGRPIVVPKSVAVELTTNLGYVKSPVKIEAGSYMTKTYITSDKAGKAVVEAEIRTKLITLKGRTAVRFLKPS